MIPQPPPGQGPIDPRGAFFPPPPPGSAGMAFPSSAMGPTPQTPSMPGSGYGGPFGYPPGPNVPPPGGYPPFMRPGFPPPRRGGFLRGILLTFFIIVLLVSLLLNLVMIGSAAAVGKSQTTITSGDVAQTVAVIPLEGVINDAEAQRFDRLVSRAENEKNVKAVVIRIDTPGGAVTASDDIYNRIRKLKSRRDGVPVVVSMGGMATSGGYYAACAGDHLFAEETTLTANIGVLLPGFNFSKLMEKWGIADQTVVSTGAIYKNAGSMFAPQAEKDQKYLQGIADAAFKRFKQVVQAGRGACLKESIDSIADGRVYVAREALETGVVDEIGYLDDAIAYTSKKAGLNHPMVVRFQESLSIFDLFNAESRSRVEGTGATFNGIHVTLDSRSIDEIRSPRLMYLWRSN